MRATKIYQWIIFMACKLSQIGKQISVAPLLCVFGSLFPISWSLFCSIGYRSRGNKKENTDTGIKEGNSSLHHTLLAMLKDIYTNHWEQETDSIYEGQIRLLVMTVLCSKYASFSTPWRKTPETSTVPGKKKICIPFFPQFYNVVMLTMCCALVGLELFTHSSSRALRGLKHSWPISAYLIIPKGSPSSTNSEC